MEMNTWKVLQINLASQFMLLIRIKNKRFKNIFWKDRCKAKPKAHWAEDCYSERMTTFLWFLPIGSSCRGEGFDNMNTHIANLQNFGVELPNSRTPRKHWLPWWKRHKMTVYLNDLISSSLKVSMGFSLWSLCLFEGLCSFTKQKCIGFFE